MAVATHTKSKSNLSDISHQFNINSGIYVAKVMAGGTADRAGVKPGDRIVGMDGQPLKFSGDLKEIRERHYIGDEIEIVINRNGDMLILEPV